MVFAFGLALELTALAAVEAGWVLGARCWVVGCVLSLCLFLGGGRQGCVFMLFTLTPALSFKGEGV